MKRIGVMMCALREETRITPAIRQFDGLGIDQIVVACSEKSWYGNVKGDRTPEIAVREGAAVRMFDWRREADQKNWILSTMRDLDWVLMFAPDMYMTYEDLSTAIKFLKSDVCNERAYSCDMTTYWKDYDHVTQPDRVFNTLAIRPNEEFDNVATLKNTNIFPKIEGITMHHLSWVKDDKSVLIKINTFSHADEIVKNWYEVKWLKWKENMGDVDPTDPTCSSSVIKRPLPKELIDHLTKYKFNETYNG